MGQPIAGRARRRCRRPPLEESLGTAHAQDRDRDAIVIGNRGPGQRPCRRRHDRVERVAQGVDRPADHPADFCPIDAAKSPTRGLARGQGLARQRGSVVPLADLAGPPSLAPVPDVDRRRLDAELASAVQTWLR